MTEEDGKEKIAGILALVGTIAVFGEILYHIYKWFGIHPVIFIVGFLLMVVAAGLTSK